MAAVAGAESAKKYTYGQYTVAKAEKLVNFCVGQPAQSMLPLDKIRAAGKAKLDEDDVNLLQYGQIPGYPELREALAKFLSEETKYEHKAENIFVTNGVTGALSLFCSLFLKTGDTVIVGEPTYFLALSIFKDFGIKTVSVPIDENGMQVDKLEELLKEGVRPKALYTVPVYHNPTGYTLSDERRTKLVALAREYDFHILADEVYEMLGFEGEDGSRPSPPKPMYLYDDAEDGHVTTVGSFSKILAPALRVGYLVCAPHVMKTMSDSGQLDSSGGINPVMSGIVHKAIDMGLQKEHLYAVQKELGERARTLSAALHKHLPEGCWFQEPSGGYFLWIRIPEGVDGALLADHAMVNHKVKVLPGVKFGDTLKKYIRLSFSYYNAEDLATGAERLGEAIKTYIANGGPVGDAAGASARAGGR